MAPQAVIRRGAAFVNAHIRLNMLRFPKRRAPWQMVRCLFFKTLLKIGATHRNRTDNLRITNALLCLVELGWRVADESTALPIELRRRELAYLLRL